MRQVSDQLEDAMDEIYRLGLVVRERDELVDELRTLLAKLREPRR